MTKSKCFLYAGAMLAVLSFNAAAEDEKKGELWVNPGLYSYHFDRSKHYRDFNYGLGAEYIVSPDHALIAGIYKNSESDTSRYLGYQWRPLHWKPSNLNVSAGVALSLIDGYPSMNNGGMFVAPLPTLSIEGRNLGVNLVFVPNVKHGSALAFQFKVKAW